MNDAERFMQAALGRCTYCGHGDVCHYPRGTYTPLFGLIERERTAGCGYIRCDCKGFVGESFLVGEDDD